VTNRAICESSDHSVRTPFTSGTGRPHRTARSARARSKKYRGGSTPT
jgi:hypothetical protein